MQHFESELATMYKECRVSTKKTHGQITMDAQKILSALLREASGDNKEEEVMRIEEILHNEAQKTF